MTDNPLLIHDEIVHINIPMKQCRGYCVTSSNLPTTIRILRVNTLLTKVFIVVLCTFCQQGHAAPKIEYGGISVSSIGFDGVESDTKLATVENSKTLGLTIATELNNYFFTGVDYSQSKTNVFNRPGYFSNGAFIGWFHDLTFASRKNTSTGIFVGGRYPIGESTDVFFKVNYVQSSDRIHTLTESDFVEYEGDCPIHSDTDGIVLSSYGNKDFRNIRRKR